MIPLMCSAAFCARNRNTNIRNLLGTYSQMVVFSAAVWRTFLDMLGIAPDIRSSMPARKKTRSLRPVYPCSSSFLFRDIVFEKLFSEHGNANTQKPYALISSSPLRIISALRE